MIGPLLMLALTPSSPPPSGNVDGGNGVARVTSLSRYAIKGLGPTPLTSVTIEEPGETFPDDRRFAFLRSKQSGSFEEDKPVWLHKENFLCAFSDPKLMAGFDCDYNIVGGDEGEVESTAADEDEDNSREARRMLTVYRRDPASGHRVSEPAALGPVDLATPDGLQELGAFFSSESGEDVVCVTASSASAGGKHVHQFGNTRSGVREMGDTRTVHLVNAATVRELSGRIGFPLNPERFRPNVIVDGLEPWSEFGWVGKKVICRKKDGDGGAGITLNVISRTVRCEGIGIDPTDPSAKLDMPSILQKFYPEHGPFLGVYAVISEPGRLELGDELTLLPDHGDDEAEDR